MLTHRQLSKDPFAEMQQMTQEMDRLFESLAPGSRPFARRFDVPRFSFPAINVWEDEANAYAEAELPGVNLEDLEVSTTHNWLTIKGKREIEHANNSTVLRSERISGTFERTIELPNEIDADHVNAELKNGVLRVTMPKAQEARRKVISVKGQ